ncbi:glycosyltransferase family 4 protein [Limoniibacter endophyticus]|uniref:Glycosyl transferase family 1 n=1 Tax=Limoniibacter endophyticus TaxID=1565040 RepID=A0A8J3GFB4_9HYPH|nr:glycosyltransferase family 4 protein [Limoniibacter endophyticus]GHC65856.1 glycosyl transferase family 1 [Limoniibacter endophyticus]
MNSSARPTSSYSNPAAVEVVAPNFKKRLSGVTSTVVQLVPVQRRRLNIATLAPEGALPDHLPRIRFRDLLSFWRKPAGRPFRIWHARRNVEMIFGLLLRDILRMPLRIVFTSAAQRDHKPFTKWLIARMDAVIATSRRSGSFLKVPHTVIMHGTDLERFSPPENRAAEFAKANIPGRYAIGCFGRVRHQKGTDLFVNAMIALLPQYPDWTAVVTGRVTAEHKPFENELKRRITAAGLQDRILLLGEVDDVLVWYKRISLYVAPSRNEGFGLTPIEAMAAGVPVVASDAGAYAEQIKEGETGAVVPAGDGNALVNKIKPYFDDPTLCERHGEAATRHVHQAFTLQREAEAIERIYVDLWARGSIWNGSKPS